MANSAAEFIIQAEKLQQYLNSTGIFQQRHIYQIDGHALLIHNDPFAGFYSFLFLVIENSKLPEPVNGFNIDVELKFNKWPFSLHRCTHTTHLIGMIVGLLIVEFVSLNLSLLHLLAIYSD